MPEPDYMGSEPPGVVGFVVGTVILLIVILTLKSCL